MDRRWKKIIASMLAVTMVLSNSNIAVSAGEVNDEDEAVMAGSDQQTVESTSTEKTEEESSSLSEEAQEEEAKISVDDEPEENPDISDEEEPEITEEQTDEEAETLGDGSKETDVDLELVEDGETDKAGEDKKEIREIKDLVELSEKNPADYQYAEIILAPHGTSEWDLSGTKFAGLGSDEYPFMGSIGFSGEYTGYITLNRALFNAVSSDAQISSTLNLKAANNMTDPILTKNYIKGKSADVKTISLKIDVKNADITEGGEQTAYSSFGGVIGILGKEASVILNVTSEIPAAKAAVSGEGSRGFFCNTMEAGASLTVSAFKGNADFSVTSTAENAGAIVGSMTAEASLSITPAFTFSGNITGANNAGGLVGSTADSAKITLQDNYTVSGSISSGNGNAGGLIGSTVNNPVAVTDGKEISVTSANLSAGASGAAGGLFGNCTISDENAAGLDLTVYTINGVSITSGKYAGGVFGTLNNKAGNYTIKIQDGANKKISSTGQEAENYGGLIGNYQADQLTFGLELIGLNITSSHTGEAKTAYSGVIAEVTGKSYVKMGNLTVNADQQVANGSYFGGLVANCSGNSGFFDIGTLSVSSTKNNTVKTDGGASGGLIGKMADGVVRLSGTTDLSRIQPGGEGSQYGQLIGSRDNVLVYAVGTGSNAGNDAGWTLVRGGSGKCVSDIGNWGEVIRVDGSKLQEGSAGLVNYDSTNHTVTVKSFDCSNISTAQDFAALALTMQCSGANIGGALRFSSSADLSNQISLTRDIDLTATGVTGLMRDNGTQDAFTGSLNGGNHTLTLDIGDAYGVKADGTTQCTSADTGCGQIYNHSYIGLFAKTGTNSISNLTVSGNINYGLSTQQEIWAGGVTAFQDAETASYQNVISDISLNYS